MELFRSTIQNLSGFNELKKSLTEGGYPCSVTGVSGIHKAQIVLGLYEDQAILVITDDEASSRRLTDDINEMYGDKLAYAYPAKDFTLTNVESVSREYEYARLEVLSKLLSKECGIVVASIEAALQVYENKHRKVTTSQLNEVMLKAIEQYHPPVVRGNAIKIKYVTQLPTHTPSFAFFCNYPDDIKAPYKNYLENKLREKFDFSGVPIRLFFRKK